MLCGAIFYLTLTVILKARRLALDEYFFLDQFSSRTVGLVAMAAVGVTIWSLPGLALLYGTADWLPAAGLPVILAAFVASALRWRWIYRRRPSGRGKRRRWLTVCRGLLLLYVLQMLTVLILSAATPHDSSRQSAARERRDSLDAQLVPFVGIWSIAQSPTGGLHELRQTATEGTTTRNDGAAPRSLAESRPLDP